MWRSGHTKGGSLTVACLQTCPISFRKDVPFPSESKEKGDICKQGSHTHLCVCICLWAIQVLEWVFEHIGSDNLFFGLNVVWITVLNSTFPIQFPIRFILLFVSLFLRVRPCKTIKNPQPT